MRHHMTVAVLMLSIAGIGGKSDIDYDAYINNEDKHKHIDPNANITPRKIRFEEDPRISDDSFDEQLGQPLRFEESPKPGERPGRVTFQDDNKIEDADNYSFNSGEGDALPTRVTFQDDNKLGDSGTKKKRRRRRRKPRYQLPQGQYNPPGLAPLGPEYPGYPGQLYPVPGGQGIGPGGQPVGQYYRPPRRPKQSYALEALSKVAGALSSIALYDDAQCVPRLLCEAAGGGTLGSAPALQAIAGLQPLLTLLSAYNGISTSPLFVFGRAVFLGMTSNGNTASCRYAYPQCPTDTEQLVHYLNNHNGGFFRFFNSPQPQIPQNVEQFYNQLSGQYGYQQNYGIYDPQLSQNQQYGNQPGQNPQNYGILNPQFGPQNLNPQYGLYQPHPQNAGPNNVQYPGFYQSNPYHQPNYQSPQGNSQYGLYNPYLGSPNPQLNSNQFNYANHQNYGPKYPYGSKYGIKNIRFKDNSGKIKIEKRIQNKPNYLYIDSDLGNVDVNSKWIFPDNGANTNDVKVIINGVRVGKNLKFPEETTKTNYENEDNRKGKSILFPESQKSTYVNYYEYTPVNNNDNFKYNYQNNNVDSNVGSYDGIKNNNFYDNEFNSNRYGLGNRYNNYNRYSYSNGYTNNDYNNGNTYSKYMYNSEDEDGVQTVYIVRGNGDPNHPEIIKVRPGEKVML